MSSQVGKSMRLKRVIDAAGVSVICALDHGMTSPTFLEPLSDIAARTAEAVAGGANVIMMSKGMIRIAEVLGLDDVARRLRAEHGADHHDDAPENPEVAFDQVLHD